MAGEGEFDFIARRLAPLTRAHSGAYGLKDDGAILAPSSDHDFAITSDTLVEGVHFPVGEDPFKVGWKALAVNVSDLIAMGAEPKTYLLNIVWPRDGFEARADGFVDGLREAQDAFKLLLVGGDTTRADGPWTISITAIGQVRGGKTPRRGGAKPGDVVVVTNQIGDAWLGLQMRLGKIDIEDARERALLDVKFATPAPPLEAAMPLHEMANAAIDVSDGLLADIAHIAAASSVGAVVDLASLPLSGVARRWIEGEPDELEARLKLATGGDDYEIAAAIPEPAVSQFRERCAAFGHAVTQIGRIEAGEGLSVMFNGAPVRPGALGFTHF